MRSQADLVVFCHLRWDFVFQRPQHLLSRISEHRRVLLIEEPELISGGEASMKVTKVSENLLVARPQSPIGVPGFSAEQMPTLRRLVEQLLQEHDVTRCISWFYTPLALPLLDATPHELVVYDCMDALDAFLHAPPLLKTREQELLATADLVFTGGPSLFRRLEGRHNNVHCFASSVDAAHFAKAKAQVTEPQDQVAISHPRLGYFGVIDERIDLALLDGVAELHPEWQIMMVGPVVKIDPATLPRRPNIHFLGQKQYADLPAYLSGWDACLLPFARNESTRFISPTKTLEYMAAEKPIVSTSITDVADPYGKIVYLADDAAAFAQACDSALNASHEEREMRAEAMRQVLAKTSWDRTAQSIEDLMDTAMEEKTTTQKVAQPQQASAEPVTESASMPPVVVIGAGPTGLSAAYHLGEDALLLEQNEKVGGWCRSMELDGFTFDFAGHIMFSNDPYVHELYAKLLGDNVHWQDREAWIYSKKTYTRYPFQGALYGLPADVIKECIVGAIEARFGPLKRPAAPAASPNGTTSGKPSDTAQSTNGNGRLLASHSSHGNGHANGNGHSNGQARQSARYQTSARVRQGVQLRLSRLRTIASVEASPG